MHKIKTMEKLPPLHDPTRWDTISVPFVIRQDERAYVVFARDSRDMPVRIPGFYLMRENCQHLEDRFIIEQGFEYMAELPEEDLVLAIGDPTNKLRKGLRKIKAKK